MHGPLTKILEQQNKADKLVKLDKLVALGEVVLKETKVTLVLLELQVIKELLIKQDTG